MPGKRKERTKLSALTIIIHSSSKYESSQRELFCRNIFIKYFHIIQILLKKGIIICTMKCWVRFWRSHFQKTKDFTETAKLKQPGFLQIYVLWLLSLCAPVTPAVLSDPQPPASTLCDLPWVTGQLLFLCQLADTRLRRTAEICSPYHRQWWEAFPPTFYEP